MVSGDHAVDFLVDSGSAVTAVSRPFFDRLSEAGAPVGLLRPTTRTLRGANGSQIEISGCSYCMVSFLGLRAEFPILVCDLSTDAIIGTDTLGSILSHTLDIKNGLLFTEGGVSLQLHRRDAALSGRVFTVGHCSIPPHSEAVLHCTTRTVGGRSLPPSGLLEGHSFFREHRPSGRADTGGPVRMEGSGTGWVMGVAILPTGGSEEIGFSLGGTPISGTTGDREYKKDSNAPVIFIHVDDLKLCPAPADTVWTPEPSTAKSLCASTVAFRPGSHTSETDSSPSVAVSSWKNLPSSTSDVDLRLDLDSPIDLNGHVLSPFAVRDFHYQDCHFHSIAHLMCYRYAGPVTAAQRTLGARHW